MMHVQLTSTVHVHHLAADGDRWADGCGMVMTPTTPNLSAGVSRVGPTETDATPGLKARMLDRVVGQNNSATFH
jgi:hypothetical protein